MNIHALAVTDIWSLSYKIMYDGSLTMYFHLPVDDFPVFDKTPIFVGDELLQPGHDTDLSGFFNRKLTYLGSVGGYLVFVIGRETNLFEDYYICELVYRVDEKRIMLHHKPGSGRDFIYLGSGVWK